MKRIEMMAAPTGMQPGGYVPVAYADSTKPATPQVQLDYERAAGRGYRVTLRWPCAGGGARLRPAVPRSLAFCRLS